MSGLVRVACAIGSEDAQIDALEREAHRTSDEQRRAAAIAKLPGLLESCGRISEAIVWLGKHEEAQPGDRRILGEMARLVPYLSRTHPERWGLKCKR